MHDSLPSLCLRKLPSLSDISRYQVIRYLTLRRTRNHADGTLVLITHAIRRLVLYLPPSRRRTICRDLAQTTAGDIDLFVAEADQRKLAPSTINNTLSLLTPFFDFLREDAEMRLQPVIRHRHRVCTLVRLPRPMAEDDVVKFFKVIDSIRDRVIFLLMLRCGLRVSEVSALAWADIDFDAGTLRINDGKGGVDRVGYLAPDVERSLRLWHKRRTSEQYVFPAQKTRQGRRSVTLSTQQIYRLMISYLRSANVIGHYSPHSLRHTFATQLLNAGVTLEVLKELMGHRTIQMTLCYAELYDSTKRQQYDQAMQRIERRQSGSGGEPMQPTEN